MSLSTSYRHQGDTEPVSTHVTLTASWGASVWVGVRGLVKVEMRSCFLLGHLGPFWPLTALATAPIWPLLHCVCRPHQPSNSWMGQSCYTHRPFAHAFSAFSSDFKFLIISSRKHSWSPWQSQGLPIRCSLMVSMVFVLCVKTSVHQLRFARNGLFFIFMSRWSSCLCVNETGSESVSGTVVCDSLWPRGL